MERLVKILFQVQEFQVFADDDFVDRMNRRYTPCILVIFTGLVTMKQYVGSPIDCWCPAQFTHAHVDYTNTVCWVSDTYYVPMEEDMPKAEEPRRMISYYQWVPMLLLCQALLFFFPYLCWRFLNRRVGLSIKALVEAGQSLQKAMFPESKDKTLRYMVMQVDSYLIRQRRTRRDLLGRIREAIARYCCFMCYKFTGSYLTFCYASVKVMYLLNIVAQLFLLDVFLGMDRTYHLYGLRVMANLFSGSDWVLSSRFPRVTLCDFQIRQQTNVHRYTVQCVLPINLFNEKIFLFIWFWFLGLAAATLVSLMYWVSHLGILSLQVHYVKRQLRSIDPGKKDGKMVRRFLEGYLRRDGLFILRIVSQNAGAVTAAELLHGLWSKYGPERSELMHEDTEHGRRTPHKVHDMVTINYAIILFVFEADNLPELSRALRSIMHDGRPMPIANARLMQCVAPIGSPSNPISNCARLSNINLVIC
jgi:hypothetical protein